MLGRTLIQAVTGAILSRGILGKPVAYNVQQPWQPQIGQTYQIILHGVLDMSQGTVPNVDIFDIDLFYHPVETIQALHSQGKKVICYFSAGTAEDWRPDYSNFTASDKGNCLPEWSGESWLNIKNDNVWTVMKNRIQLAAQKGCDAIDPDNMGKCFVSLIVIPILNSTNRRILQRQWTRPHSG
jgi:hypothetical protein